MEDSETLRRFVRNVVKVSKRKQEAEKAREQLGQQVEKVKKLAVKKDVKKATVSRALKELENKLSEVLEKEKETIALQKKDISKTDDISSDLKSVKEQIKSFTTRDALCR